MPPSRELIAAGLAAAAIGTYIYCRRSRKEAIATTPVPAAAAPFEPNWIEQDEFERRRALFGSGTSAEPPTLTENSSTVGVVEVPSDLPDNATVIGQLAVWPFKAEPEEEEEEEEDPPQRHRKQQPKPPSVLKLEGRDLQSGARFWYHSSIGRCNMITLRLGDKGLWYSSSSHGTMTLHLRTYKSCSGTSGEDEDAVDEVVVVEGNHSRGPKSETAPFAAQRFVLRLFAVAGRASKNSPLDSITPKAWVKLLEDLGLGSEAFLLSVVFLPWLGVVNGLNESVTCGWHQADFPSTIDGFKEDWYRELLQRYLPEGHPDKPANED